MNTKNVLENAVAHARQINDKACDDCAVHDHDDQLQADYVTLAIEIERLQDLQRIVTDLTDPDPCTFDHHGYCQAHGWFDVEPKCPHARAKDLIGKEKITLIPANPKRNCPSCEVEMGLYCSHCQQEFEQ